MTDEKIIQQLILSAQLNELHGAIEIIEDATAKILNHKRGLYLPIIYELHNKRNRVDEKLSELKESLNGDWGKIYDEAMFAKEDLRIDILRAANEIQNAI